MMMRQVTFVAAFLAGAFISTETEASSLRLLKSTSHRHKLAREAVCKAANDFCKAIVGKNSYCQEKKEGKFFCHGSDFQCNCESTEQAEEATTTVAPTEAPSTASCDDYCISLNGSGDYCKDWVSKPKCQKGGQPCGKAVCGAQAPATSAPEETVTTPIPTSAGTTTTATTKKPKVNVTRRTQEVPANPTTTPIPNASGECEDLPSGETPAALWIENTTGLSTSRDAVNKFYARVLAFVNGNCAKVRTTKLIVRVYHPEYPSKEGSYYAPSADSALFTELLSKLPRSAQVHFYPYIMDAYDQGKWEAYGGSSDVIANVFKFTADWNKVLAAAGVPSVRGVILDNEEIRSWSNHAQLISESNINKLKAANGNLDFGITIGFDETPKLEQWASFVDMFYLQAYDFYAPTAHVGQTSDSRFLTMEDDAVSLSQYVDGSAIAQRQWDAYAKNPSRVTLMWSTQEISGKGCLYPLNNGSCGDNHEFGSWSPRAFNEFLQDLKQRNPTAAAVEHAIFQFSFMPKSWMPMSARN